jgi:GT2 family glycosyltransferase
MLSVIIVSWNTKDMTLGAVRSVLAETGVPLEVIVVDNASSDGSVQALRTEFPRITVIESTRNAGFAHANNIGLRRAGGDILMLLNSDTVVLPGAFGTMVAHLAAHPETGLVGPKLVWPDGRFQKASFRNLPDIGNSLFYLLGLDRIRKALGGKPYKDAGDPNVSRASEALSGAAMMFRRSVYEKIGGLDERFFMYGEDLDFCKRAGDAGFGIRYLPDAVIVHFGGESSRKRKAGAIRDFYRAAWLYYEKHFALRRNPFLNALVFCGIKTLYAAVLLRNLFRFP